MAIVSEAHHQTTDTSEMSEAIRRLVLLGYKVSRPQPNQLKIGKWSYWPSKGSFFEDGRQKKEEQRGLDEFIKVLPSLYSVPLESLFAPVIKSNRE